MAKSILLSVEDVPTKLELIHAASRLKKCYELLSKSRGTSNKEDPNSLLAAANFLDMLVKRESKILRKTNNAQDDDYIKSLPEEEQRKILEEL